MLGRIVHGLALGRRVHSPTLALDETLGSADGYSFFGWFRNRRRGRRCVRLWRRRATVAGLIAQFGGQAVINMAVNTQIFPSKGMTLPFISYGGTAMVTLGLSLGLLLSIARVKKLVKT